MKILKTEWTHASSYFGDLNVYYAYITYKVSTYRREEKCALDWKKGKKKAHISSALIFSIPPGDSNVSLILSKNLTILLVIN